MFVHFYFCVSGFYGILNIDGSDDAALLSLHHLYLLLTAIFFLRQNLLNQILHPTRAFKLQFIKIDRS